MPGKSKPKLNKKKAEKKEKDKATPLQSVRGMSDLLPKDELWWKAVSSAGSSVAELHDFHFIETPVLEQANLFERGVGETTDIVEKEMYVFKTRGGERVTLRPEGTAPVMRSYLEHHLGYFASPLKVFYQGPMFRYERPQAGRERQHHQLGFEILGDSDPFYDVEIIIAALDFLRTLKFKDMLLKINTIGCRVCRPSYREKLKNYYTKEKDKLCDDCKRRLERNPLRLLDCKEEGCIALRAKAPIILDYLCQNCNNHFKAVLELVEDNNIPYEPDPYLVRGLDYYNRTVFELQSGQYKLSLAGGGRYDYLGELLGARSIPAVGVALGLERVIDAMRVNEINPHVRSKSKVFFVAVGDQAKKSSLKYISELRANGVGVMEVVGKKSFRAQLKVADKMKSRIALIFGQKEAFEGSIIIRDMVSGAQETVMIGKFVEEVKKRL